MSTPADRAPSRDAAAEKTVATSHAVAQQAAGAHSAALAKLHGQIMSAPNPGQDGQMQMLQAIHSMVSQQHGQGQSQGQGDGQGANDLPDPADLVDSDPQAAMTYAEAIMAAVAHKFLNEAAAPGGEPMSDGDQAGPAVGGGEGPAY